MQLQTNTTAGAGIADVGKILAVVSSQLWGKSQEKRTSDSTDPVCLMVDDTDYPKRGIQTELIGKIYSQVTHSMMLGFKGLFIGITDGISQILLDYVLADSWVSPLG